MPKPRGVLPALASRAELVASADTEDSLAALKASRSAEARLSAAREFAREVEEGRASYGGMLARIWKEAQRTLVALEEDESMTPAKRVSALRELGKLLPMLAKAEENHTARIGGVDVREMSERQLERELKRLWRERKKASG